MKPPLPRLEVSREELQSLLEHARMEALSEPEYQQLKAALDTLVYLTQLVEDKNTTIGRLRQILFGASTEKMSQVLQALTNNRTTSGEPESSTPSEEQTSSPPQDSAPSPGHGRNGAKAYSGARQVKIEHSSFKSGNRCPGCQKGKLYALATPGMLIRVVGQAPLAATVYELEKLRCNLCGEVFTAEAPEGVGTEKYDATAASMIALLKYGSGLPFHRLERLQGSMGIPLPASTQWEIVAETAEWIEPIYQELIHQAAQGKVLHNDDTTMKILALMADSLPRQPSVEEESEEKSERTGIFTSGIVSTRAGQKIALFFTGRKHAGENLATVLAHGRRSWRLRSRCATHCRAISPRSFKSLSRTVSRTGDAGLSRSRRSSPKNAVMCWRHWERCTSTMPSAGSRRCRRRNVSATTKPIAVRG